MDLKEYTPLIVVVLSLITLSVVLLIYLNVQTARNIPVSEPYMDKFDCYLNSPDVICSVEVCNAGSTGFHDVMLTFDVFDEWNNHFRVVDETNYIGVAGSISKECFEFTGKVHNDSLGPKPRVKGVLSYTTDDGVVIAGLTLFNIW